MDLTPKMHRVLVTLARYINCHGNVMAEARSAARVLRILLGDTAKRDRVDIDGAHGQTYDGKHTVQQDLAAAVKDLFENVNKGR